MILCLQYMFENKLFSSFNNNNTSIFPKINNFLAFGRFATESEPFPFLGLLLRQMLLQFSFRRLFRIGHSLGKWQFREKNAENIGLQQQNQYIFGDFPFSFRFFVGHVGLGQRPELTKSFHANLRFDQLDNFGTKCFQIRRWNFRDFSSLHWVLSIETGTRFFHSDFPVQKRQQKWQYTGQQLVFFTLQHQTSVKFDYAAALNINQNLKH